MKMKYDRPVARAAHIPAILVERDYKGEYERFALTPDEFKAQFPDYNKIPVFKDGKLTVLPVAAPDTKEYKQKIA